MDVFGMNSSGSGRFSVAASHKQGNENSESIHDGNCLSGEQEHFYGAYY
jgi:hypothetical protein